MEALGNYETSELQDKRKEMPRLSIGIYGSPGSGKSSLMETFVQMVNKKPKDSPVNIPRNVYSLPVIKPNILAKDENFLYKFLATALSEEKKRKRDKGDYLSDSSILTELEEAFQKVSRYLQVIDATERRQDDDPLGVSLDRLDRHESGVKLVEEMEVFIEALADSLAGSNISSVVFMPVDDADMSMETLISAIGTFSRYLQHPKIIPIFTFTGRLAEELLQAHFEQKLILGKSKEETHKLKEASTSLYLTENMAIQYLGKLFPVRNRIRMGPASARILGAKFTSSQYERKIIEKKEGEIEETKIVKKFKVIELLEGVSKFLFGHARVPIVPAIRPPLRMVTLRRQVQIVDAMQATGLGRLMWYIEGLERKKIRMDERLAKECQLDKSWGQLFDLGTWTLLNTHRDVLKEINMNIDDLYGWTPKGMRQVLLDSILKMGHNQRSRLIKHWRYRTEDRRSQLLSLLAANVFRPRMAGEEPTGDSPDLVKKWIDMSPADRIKPMNYNSVPVSEGLIWFIDLCIGFYVPQILACNRKISEREGKDANPELSNADNISGVGWDFSSGPIHAIREAIRNNKVFSTGMMFLEPLSYINRIKTKAEKVRYPRSALYIYLWSVHGFKEGKPWAAVSLWRGLAEGGS